jgi:cell division protein FtsI (penicillin-binding protein 3)
LQVVRGTAAVANGGILVRPTIQALPASAHGPDTHATGAGPIGVRVMQESTSLLMRKLMRLVVTDGFGKSAEVPGYYVGGKTGTAEKVGAHGYRKHTNVAAFMSVFPMNAPRYAVYMMLDEPKGNKATYGYATAGWVAAPAAGRVISRIGPMLGLLPDVQNAPAINQALSIPLQPGRPPGAPTVVAATASARGGAVAEAKPASPAVKAAPARQAGAPVPRATPTDSRHEAASAPPPAARLLPVSVNIATQSGSTQPDTARAGAPR